LGDRWVLVVNLNPGGVAGGSGGQYFIGQFDGKTFRNDNPPDRTLWLDYGKDMYATVSFSDIPDGRRIWVGWMSNWMYANKEPTATWRTAQSLPREVELRQGRLIQRPVREARSMRGKPWTEPSAVRGEVVEIEAEIEASGAEEAGFRVRKGAGAQTTVAWFPRKSEVAVDRRKSGEVAFHKEFASIDRAPLGRGGNRVKLHIFLDRSSVEVFANDGEVTLTNRIFPPPGANAVEFYTSGGAARLVSFKAFPLE
jgi:fructan beta-fructosidase